jgi:antitoxin CcdA
MRMKTLSGTERAAKRPANLSVNSDLLNQARELGINFSATLEEALAAEVRSQRELWLEENQEAIAAYNEHVAQNSVWSDGQRGF